MKGKKKNKEKLLHSSKIGGGWNGWREQSNSHLIFLIIFIKLKSVRGGCFIIELRILLISCILSISINNFAAVVVSWCWNNFIANCLYIANRRHFSTPPRFTWKLTTIIRNAMRKCVSNINNTYHLFLHNLFWGLRK